MTRLVEPDVRLSESWCASVHEFAEVGERHLSGAGLWNLPDEVWRPADFAACEAVDRGEVPQPLAAPAPARDAGDQPTGRDGGDGGDDSSGSVVAAVTSPSGAVTPSLLPLAGGAALAVLLLATRRRTRRRDRRQD